MSILKINWLIDWTTVLTSLVSPKFVMNSIEESWQHGLHHPERRVHFFQYTHHRIMSLNIFNGLHQGLAGVVSRTLGLLATEVWLKSDGAIGWYNLCSIINITGSYNGIVPYTTIWNVTLLVIKIQYTLFKCLVLPFPKLESLIRSLTIAVWIELTSNLCPEDQHLALSSDNLWTNSLPGSQPWSSKIVT